MIGLGIDAVDISRFRSVIGRTPQLITRVFTAGEMQDVAHQQDAAASLAARFAVREATMKVLGVGLGAIDMHDVSVARLPTGQPTLRVTGRAERLAEQRGITQWHVSLSHTSQLAIAVVAAS